MKISYKYFTVNELLDLRKNNMLTVNAEYQRAPVWNDIQNKKLIDSILRRYPIPLFYLHHIKREIAGFLNETFEIIDGQQRLLSLDYFKEDALTLLDPKKDEKKARFPNFIRNEPCEWASKTFSQITPELKARFLDTKLSVVQIESDDSLEVRDLFIRLQAGLPLTAQEKRDAWPGGYCEFVLKFGGKPELTRYQGHIFFNKLLNAKAGKGRVKIRQLCAQLGMLFFEKRKLGNYVSIGTQSLDDYYYHYLEFDSNSNEVQRFSKILDKVSNLLGDGKRKRFKGHEVIHLILLVDTLIDDYTHSWESSFAEAYDNFTRKVAESYKTKYDPNPSEYWSNYVVHTRTLSDEAETIQRRHYFFCKKMFENLKGLKLRDTTRIFGQLEREIIYFRDEKQCFNGDGEILWEELEIHHVEPFVDGGKTILENGKAMHKDCHKQLKTTDS